MSVASVSRRTGVGIAASVALAAAAVLAPAHARAVVNEDEFRVRTAQDLVDLCGVSASDPHALEAIHFCHGFVSGAWQYYLSSISGPDGVKIVCPPDPPPTRNEAVGMFVAWSHDHPEYMGDPAVDTLFRWATSKYPCPPHAADSQGGKAK
jgi:hypothetical protein